MYKRETEKVVVRGRPSFKTFDAHKVRIFLLNVYNLAFVKNLRPRQISVEFLPQLITPPWALVKIDPLSFQQY